jgi:hypothetical protein
MQIYLAIGNNTLAIGDIPKLFFKINDLAKYWAKYLVNIAPIKKPRQEAGQVALMTENECTRDGERARGSVASRY